MPKQKLTLTVDEAVAERAHAYGRAHGTSISRLVNDFLARLTVRNSTEQGPLVRELTGILPSGVDLDEYRRHMEEKHG